jgi:hypothetical protein
MKEVPVLLPVFRLDTPPHCRSCRTGSAKYFPSHVSHDALTAEETLDLSAPGKIKGPHLSKLDERQGHQKSKAHPETDALYRQGNLRAMDPHLDQMVRQFITTLAI